MDLTNWIEQEKIIHYEVALKKSTFKNYLLFLESFCPTGIREWEGGYYHHFIQDTWSLLECGPDYKTGMMQGEVILKDARHFLLHTLAQHEQIINNTSFFSTSPIRNLLMATTLVNKIVQWFYNEIDPFNIMEVGFIKNQEGSYKYEIIKEGFRQIENNYLHAFHLFLEKTIVHTIDQITAAEALLGTTSWMQLQPHEIERLLENLEGNHFSEVHMYKNKMDKNKFETLHRESKLKDDSTFIFCVQQDQSMQLVDHLQISLALILGELAKHYKYDFIYLPFAQTIRKETVALKGALDASKYFEMDKEFIGGVGPIQYKGVINFAFTLLKLELSSISGKVALLCNERLFENLPTDMYWKEAVLKFKAEKGIEINVIYTGDRDVLTDIWFADHVFLLEDFVAMHAR